MTLIRISVFLLLALSLEMPEAQRTVTTTETSTRITTVTVTNNFVCAKLVNVTSACRRSRNFLIDEPVVLTFEEGLEELINEAFHHVLHPQFIPSRTLGVEVTPLVIGLPDTNVQQYFRKDYHNPSVPSSLLIHVVQPSIRSDTTRYAGRNKIGAERSKPEPRLYFSQINALFNAIANIFRPNPPVTVTVTNFVSQTTSIIVGGTTSTTFFVMKCTPSPFPFPTCSVANRRSSQISTNMRILQFID